MAVVFARTSNLEHAGGAFVDSAAAGADDETVAIVGPPLNGRRIE
jgi:hypothetical protein